LLSAAGIKRLHLADVTMPEGGPLAGRDCPVNAFVVRHPEAILIVDTGIGEAHPGIDALYRPVRRSLIDALAEIAIAPNDVALVINSHLHFDHCGANQLFLGKPIFVQRAEFEAAREPSYTIIDRVNFSGAKFEILDDEAEVLQGVTIVPTPGHTPGHQSVLLETDDGRVIIAGQAAYTAEEYSNPDKANAPGLEGAWNRNKYLESLRRLRELAPRRVYFSHDPAVWETGE
jgi:N-acyl homoserine lactone hydrolase